MVNLDALKIPTLKSILDLLWEVSLLLWTSSQLLSDGAHHFPFLLLQVLKIILSPLTQLTSCRLWSHHRMTSFWCCHISIGIFHEPGFYIFLHHIIFQKESKHREILFIGTITTHHYRKASFTLSIYPGKIDFSLFIVVHLLRLTNRLRWALIGNILSPTHLHSSICVMSLNKICHLGFSLTLEWVTFPAPLEPLSSHKNSCSRTTSPATSVLTQTLIHLIFTKLWGLESIASIFQMPAQGHRIRNRKPGIRARNWPSVWAHAVGTALKDLRKTPFSISTMY